MRDEKELIANCIKGKRESQKELYTMFAPKMLGVCYRYATTFNSAEDILQEGFIKVFKNLSKFKGQGSFEGWVRRIMVNTALDIIKKYNNYKNEMDIDDYSDKIDVPEDALDRLYSEDIVEAIRELPPGYKVVLNLYAVEGYSHKEIGEMLDITESTSRSQFSRAKVLLAKKLNRDNTTKKKINEKVSSS